MTKPIKISSDGNFLTFDELPGANTERLASMIDPILVVSRKDAEILRAAWPDIKLRVYEEIEEK